MEEAFHLREYRNGDLPALFALDVMCFERPFRFSRRALAGMTAAPGAVTLVAVDPGEVVRGFILVQRQAAGMAYVATIDVDPAWRRRGLGMALLEAGEQAAEQAGLAWIALDVHTGNAAAMAFYESCGYARTGLRDGFYGAGVDAFAYRRRLRVEQETDGRS